MVLLRDPIPDLRRSAFEPQPLHIPAANPNVGVLIERGEAPTQEQEPGENLPGTNVFEIDIS